VYDPHHKVLGAARLVGLL